MNFDGYHQDNSALTAIKYLCGWIIPHFSTFYSKTAVNKRGKRCHCSTFHWTFIFKIEHSVPYGAMNHSHGNHCDTLVLKLLRILSCSAICARLREVYICVGNTNVRMEKLRCIIIWYSMYAHSNQQRWVLADTLFTFCSKGKLTHHMIFLNLWWWKTTYGKE